MPHLDEGLASPRPPADQAIEHLGVRIDLWRHQASVGGRILSLTPTEFRLLRHLVCHPGQAFTRMQLVEAAIGPNAPVLERTVDQHIKALRRKLGQPLIETVYAVGYRFCADAPPGAST